MLIRTLTPLLSVASMDMVNSVVLTSGKLTVMVPLKVMDVPASLMLMLLKVIEKEMNSIVFKSTVPEVVMVPLITSFTSSQNELKIKLPVKLPVASSTLKEYVYDPPHDPVMGAGGATTAREGCVTCVLFRLICCGRRLSVLIIAANEMSAAVLLVVPVLNTETPVAELLNKADFAKVLAFVLVTVAADVGPV